MYIRRDKDCKEVSPQPQHVTVQDAYGNSFENWCVDFKGADSKCLPNGKTGCAPQDPDGLIGKWQPHYSDNSDRIPSPYIAPPLIPTKFINDTIDNISVDTTPVLVLGLSQDRDMVVFNENQIQYIQLEDNTTLMPGVVYS